MHRVPFQLTVLVLFAMLVLSGCQRNGNTEHVVTANQSAESCLDRLKELGATLEKHANGNLKSINLVGMDVDDAALNGLGQFKTLEKVVIASHDKPNDRVTDAAIAQLSGSTTLKELDLCGTAVTSDVLPKLQNMKALSQLKMSGKLSGNGLKVLGTQFPALTTIAFDRSDINDNDLIEIAKAKKLLGLFLAHTNITDKGMPQLASLTSLKNIRLSNTAVTDEGVKSLVSLKALINVDLSNTNVGDAVLVTLREMPQLERLNLYSTHVTDAGVDSLLPLINLNWLNLDACRISDVSIPKLATLKKLTFLHLGRTDISDVCIDTLKTMPHVKELYVTRTKITRQGAESLVAALPKECSVFVDKVVDDETDVAVE
ncbi:MAG: hypothetical protein FWD31_03870 [Planctomycetaceae bacterium]|nr:hypothetical protein [Planctomycetaceae bacterium]